MIPICHVQILPLMSGAQRSMLEILRFLDRTVFEPHVVCQEEGPLTEELSRRDIQYHCVPELQRWLRPRQDFAAYRALKQLFVRHRFQIVHNQSAKPRLIGTYAARHAGVPAIINHVRGYPFHAYRSKAGSYFYQKAEARLAKLSDKTIYVNDEDRLYALKHRLVPEDQAITIYNGADLNALDPTGSATVRNRFRRKFHLSDETVTILFLGRLDTAKQPGILPAIASELRSRSTKRPWKLLVAGEGELEDELKRGIEQHQVQDCIELIGWQTKPIGALHGSDIVLMPSLWEGLPRTLIEAQAAGVPSVGSDARGIREVITPETGRIVPIHDASGYAIALSELIDNPLLRNRMALAARHRAEEHFDTIKNNQRIIDIYHKLLGIPYSVYEDSIHAA